MAPTVMCARCGREQPEGRPYRGDLCRDCFEGLGPARGARLWVPLFPFLVIALSTLVIVGTVVVLGTLA